MPFKSIAQKNYLWMAHPAVAREFASKTPAAAKLPKHAPRRKSRTTSRNKARNR